MRKLMICAVSVIVMSVFVSPSFAEAKEKKARRTGTYETSRGGSGSFTAGRVRGEGYAKRGVKWESENGGEGKRGSVRHWDKELGAGVYGKKTELPSGETYGKKGVVVKTGEGEFTQREIIKGPDGKITRATKDYTRNNEDGTVSVDATYERPGGKTLEVDKTIEKTEDGRVMTGTYETGGGKTGTFTTNVTRDEGSVSKTSERVNAEGETWTREYTRTREDGVMTTERTRTDPDGESQTYSRTLTLDTPEEGESDDSEGGTQ